MPFYWVIVAISVALGALHRYEVKREERENERPVSTTMPAVAGDLVLTQNITEVGNGRGPCN